MFTKPGDEASQLASSIATVIQYRSSNSLRSRQKALGISEVGEPCVRKLAYKLLDTPKVAAESDPWPSIQGTAIHAWLAEAFERYNTKGAERFLIEFKVKVTDEIQGTCDLFDIADKMIIDHKCMGAASMKARKAGGMTATQRVQVNLYAYGAKLLGYEVEKVALACYPLGGRLDGLHTIIEDYNEELALSAIERLDDIKLAITSLDLLNNPFNWNSVPSEPSYSCIYCPFYLPGSTDLSVGCPGQVDVA